MHRQDASALRRSRRNWTAPARRPCGDHAEIAVDGLGRVQEKSRAAGAGERRRDLVADVARFAHAGDDDAALASQQQIASPRE